MKKSFFSTPSWADRPRLGVTAMDIGRRGITLTRLGREAEDGDGRLGPGASGN